MVFDRRGGILIEALFQTATGLGFDGNDDGDTADDGPAGSIGAQLVENASGDVPAFTSIDDPVGFSFRMLDVANVPTLPLDTTITRTMNPGSLNDVFQFEGTAGERFRDAGALFASRIWLCSGVANSDGVAGTGFEPATSRL